MIRTKPRPFPPVSHSKVVPEPKTPPKGAPPVDLDAFLVEMKKLGAQFKEVADKVADEAQFQFDKELARALAKHPDLYAEVRKTLRQIKKTADKTVEALGFKEP
jgi:hypothetical protein